MELSLQATLPFIGIGSLTLLISLCFCCYMRRLRERGRRQDVVYHTIRYKKSQEHSEEICPICLEDFCGGDKLALCSCLHQFHTKCLLQWLASNTTCPMCKKDLGVQSEPGENTNLVHVAPGDSLTASLNI